MPLSCTNCGSLLKTPRANFKAGLCSKCAQDFFNDKAAYLPDEQPKSSKFFPYKFPNSKGIPFSKPPMKKYKKVSKSPEYLKFLSQDDISNMVKMPKQERIKFYSQKRRDYWVSQGRCQLCGRYPEFPSESVCSHCKKKREDLITKKVAAAKDNKICRVCFKNPVDVKLPPKYGSQPAVQQYYAICSACRKKSNDALKLYRAKNLPIDYSIE